MADARRQRGLVRPRAGGSEVEATAQPLHPPDHPGWWDVKAGLKSGTLTLDSALVASASRSRPVVELVALARLGAGDRYDEAASTAIAVMWQAAIPAPTPCWRLNAAGRQSILSALPGHDPLPPAPR
jgi:hypothetical protein